MKITAGKNKGKILTEFKLSTTRPTSELVRQALFDTLGNDLSNLVFLDLFGGTGAVACEAVSRNVERVYVVDNNKESISIINKNVSLIKAKNVNVIMNNYEKALKFFNDNNIKFDIIFIDPPYATDFAEKSIDYIFENKLLNSGGCIIWEHDKTKLDVLNNYNVIKTKKYGIKYLSIIK